MSASGYYTRMFPKLAESPSIPGSEYEKALEKLGEAMVDDDTSDGPATAGYTYLGQLIDHDLTFDITPPDEAHPYASGIRNFRTPFLDLDNIYSGGPTVSPFLYEGRRTEERFLVGCTKAAKDSKFAHGQVRWCDSQSSPDDLPRDERGIALVGDPRQDENLIIAQLHVAFLKYHNRVLEALQNPEAKQIQSAGPRGGTFFQQAQRFVVWNYQYVVLNDFLRTLLDKQVFEDLERKWNTPVRIPSFEFPSFQIPIEFSAAAFRFGHSMVRDSYHFYNSKRRDVDLLCLMALTGQGSKEIECDQFMAPKDASFALPAEWVIEWPSFFELPNQSYHANNFRRIDTKIAKRLHELTPATVKLFNALTFRESRGLTPPHKSLPVRTLVRGARMGLPTGEAVAAALKREKRLKAKQIAAGPHEKELTTLHRNEKTPLWYYILKEAEVCADGARLGPIGSRIVGEVIVQAVRADPTSYLSLDPGWQPFLAGQQRGEMNKILEFLGG